MKRAVKEKLFGIWGRGSILIYTWMHRGRFRSWGKSSRVAPGLRVSCPWAIEVGRNVMILEKASLNVKDRRTDGRATLIIGDNVQIGRFVHINALLDVVIESDVLITHRVLLGDEDHIYENTSIPIHAQGTKFKGPVLLKSGCWIGTGVIILPGVVIGRNSVVGGNSVVTKDVPDYAVVVGNPAKVIKQLQGPAVDNVLKT